MQLLAASELSGSRAMATQGSTQKGDHPAAQYTQSGMRCACWLTTPAALGPGT